MFLISPLDGFEIQTEPYGRTWLTRTISWDSSLNPKLVLHKKYSGPCELRLNLLGLRAVVGSHGSGWSQKKEIIKKKKKKETGPLMYAILSFFPFLKTLKTGSFRNFKLWKLISSFKIEGFLLRWSKALTSLVRFLLSLLSKFMSFWSF